MEHAGLVLDYAPELADQVIGGEVTLNEAATAAEQKRTEADRRAEARRQRKEQLAKLREILAPMDELLKPEFEEIVKIGTGDPSLVDPLDDSLAAFPIAWGWYQRARRTALAAVHLQAAGFGNECAPLFRLQLELSVGIQWLARDKDRAAVRIHKRAQEKVKKRYQAVKAVGLSVDDKRFTDVLELDIPDDDKTLDHLLAMQHQLSEGDLSFPHHTVLYLTETAYSHATYDTAAEYHLDLGEGNWLPLVEPREPMGLSAYTLGSEAVMIAADGLSQLLKGNPWTDEISALNKRCEAKLLAKHGEGKLARRST